jgi:autotransporter-associated beta strand protein
MRKAVQKSLRFLSVASALVALAMVGGHAQAQSTFTWDNTVGTTGPQDGSGTWSTSASGTNWWDGTTNVAWPNTSSSTAVFGASGTSGTVTVSGSVTAGGITFAPVASWATTRYVITGGTIGLGSNATILVNGSASAWNTGPSINSALVASNLTITATGPYTTPGSYTGVTFSLGGANTLTGTTTLNGSLYFFSTSSGLGAATLRIMDGVTFHADSDISNDLIISGFGISGARGAIRIVNAARVFSGTVTLEASANIFGNSFINATFLRGFNETAGTAKSLYLQNSGTTFLLGNSTYTGTTFVQSGSVVLDGGANTLSPSSVLSLPGAGRVVLGGTVNGAANQSLAGLSGATTATIVGGASTISVLSASIASGTSFTYQGILGGTAANENNLAITKAGAGVLTLTGTQNNYAGNTTISAGTLALGANATMVNSPVITVGDTGSSGAVLDLTAKTGTFTFGSAQTVRGVGTINFGAGKTVAAQGIWAPGNSIGSNAVTGNLALSGTSEFELGAPGSTASSPGTSDFTSVSGTLTLGGNLALLDNSGSNSQGSYGAGSYRLFTAPSLSGTFASVTAPAGATTTRVGMVYTAGTASGQGVFANVYNLASATSAQTVNVGNMYAGSTKTTGVSLANFAPASATFTETLSGSFSGVTTNFSATGSASGIAGQSSGSGTLLVGFGSGLAAGVQTGTATLSLFSNAVNSSGLAQQSAGSQAVTITGTVWNPAAVNSISSPVAIGNVRVGGTFGTSVISIANTAASSSFTEVLGATGATSGLASLTGSVSALTGGGTSTAISIGLGGSANTGSAGLKSGTATISFTSTGGPGTASIASQNVAITGTVWNTAVGSIASGTTANLGLIHAGGAFTASTLAIANTAAAGGFSEGLNASVSGSTGNATFGGTAITNLTAGGTESTITVGLGDTATGGVKNGTITIGYQSNGSTTSGLSTISAGSQVVSLTGSVFSGNGIWNTNGGGMWGSLAAGTNWTSAGGVQAAPGTFTGYDSTDSATFAGAVTGGTATITLGSANPSLAALTFNSGSASYQLSGGTLGLSGGTSSALVSVASGSHGIGSAIGLASNASIDVAANSLLTLSGVVSGSSAGLTKTGQGRLVLEGANTYTGLTQVSGSGSALAINGSVAGNVQVGTGAVLAGSGVIAGNLGGSGLIDPGNSPGILTVQGQLDATSTTAFAFELSGTGAPIWGSASASGNDVLRLTATSPFTSSLAATNIVNVYFDRASLANGDTFQGGFFVDNGSSTANLLTNGLGSADFQYFVRGDGNGGYAYNGTNYYSLSQYISNNSGITGVTQSVVNVASATFNGGTITTGQVTQFVIVPEPAAIAMALMGIAGAAGWSMRRRRR